MNEAADLNTKVGMDRIAVQVPQQWSAGGLKQELGTVMGEAANQESLGPTGEAKVLATNMNWWEGEKIDTFINAGLVSSGEKADC